MRYKRILIRNPNFEGSVYAKFSRSRGCPPRTIFAQIDRPINALQLFADGIYTKKLVADFLQVMCNFRRKAAITLTGKCVVDLLIVLIEFFSLGVTAEAL